MQLLQLIMILLRKVRSSLLVELHTSYKYIVLNIRNISFTATCNPTDYTKKDVAEKSSDKAHFSREHYISNQGNVETSYGFNHGKFNKAVVKVAEVQTQTVNDIATQTDISADERNVQNRLSEIRENAYEPFSKENEIPQLSLDSAEQFEDLDRIEEISLPSRIRTMSEISLHETTSSIKTETGTEISISTRGVTCSFNQYIGSEVSISCYIYALVFAMHTLILGIFYIFSDSTTFER